jgi:hypothetical protein
MDLSALGEFVFLDNLSGPELSPFARRVERLGHRVLWYTEGVGRESHSRAQITVSARHPDRQGAATAVVSEASADEDESGRARRVSRAALGMCRPRSFGAQRGAGLLGAGEV